MDTAIAEQIDTLEADGAKEAFERGSTAIVFLSRRRELRLIRVPRYPVLAPGSARQVGQEPGECINFLEGRFVCPREGDVELEDGRKVDAGDLLEWLEDHKLNGDVNGGFWRVDPQAPAVSQLELEALVRAAGEGDEEALEAIIAKEIGGWQRKQILQVAQGALERVKQVNELVRREADLDAREAALAGGTPPAEPVVENPPAPILGELAEGLHGEQPAADDVPPAE